jgi:4-amino-4-deoxy-L-arabinose transferase-like glycosyltransferase
MAVASFAFCLAVQGFSGAWSAGFDGCPDEASHFVGAAMMRDWLASGRWFEPLEFARNYYNHFPFFAVGYWPPLFHFLTAIWLFVAGVGRQQSLLIPAAFAAGTGWLVFELVQPRAGLVAGVCAGTLYMSLPVARQSMCQVMVDHMTAFLCIATAVCLIRYLKQPVLWNGIFCAVSCGCAILSKYSALYTAVLPFLAVLLLRRFELLRKPSLLVQPFVVALIVGPWVLWTRKLASYGLPSEREALTVKRAASFVLVAFKIFPPVLLAVILLGLIALLVRPRAWRDDIVVSSLFSAGHLAFLILSPVGAESRYLLVPAAFFLVAAFTGWSEALAMISSGGRWASAISAVVAILTVFVVFQLAHAAPMPQDRFRNVVEFIVKDPARVGQRIVMDPDFEGPLIAEFVVQSRHRPSYYLLRPGKILAYSDWFGGNYSSDFGTPEKMMEYFRQHPVSLIIWNKRPEIRRERHGAKLEEMLQQYPLSWHEVVSFGSEGVSASSWTIYEYYASPH